MTVRERVTPVPDPAALPTMDLGARVALLRDRLARLGVDGLVVSELTNIRYLTGFTGSSAMVLVTPARLLFVTDGRYTTQAHQQLSEAGVDAEVETTAESPDTLVGRAANGLQRLGLEANSVSWADQRRWSTELFGGDLVPTTAEVETLRERKDAGEVARIRGACDIADRALARVRPLLGDEPTEREFAMALDAAMLELGAEELSFETIVASGPNGARPHHRPSDRRVIDGDLVVIDFGAVVDGYHSDMTRTVAVGEPDAECSRMLAVVLEAQASGVEGVRAGVDAVAVDGLCRGVIDRAGMGELFVHGTGHGVGLDIHEEPRLSTRSAATLADGHVVTVEPGVYLPGRGGVRIEDSVLVTEDGCERLTLAPKDPVLA